MVLSLNEHTFVLGPAVLSESVQLRVEIEEHIAAGRLTLPNENLISAFSVASISGAYNLGVGESECIALCQADDEANLWSDDRRARSVGRVLLGVTRIVGTADLLRECAVQGLLTTLDAYTAYELARSRGAFLPPLARQFFDTS